MVPTIDTYIVSTSLVFDLQVFLRSEVGRNQYSLGYVLSTTILNEYCKVLCILQFSMASRIELADEERLGTRHDAFGAYIRKKALNRNSAIMPENTGKGHRKSPSTLTGNNNSKETSELRSDKNTLKFLSWILTTWN